MFFRLQFAWVILLTPNRIDAIPRFSDLQYNPHWYRTFDSTSDIIPDKGELLFNWKFEDPAKQPDSFYVGIDTLWAMPQDLNADTNQDWDLQVCPDGFCMQGLKAGVHGAEAPNAFGGTAFETEHHFEFFPAVSAVNFLFTAPHGSVFGALMFARSRTTGVADTVLGFGTWGLQWDTANLPPVRPVAGYLPKKSDFIISGDTVSYKPGASAISKGPNRSGTLPALSIKSTGSGLSIAASGLLTEKRVAIFSVNGTQLWQSERIAPEKNEVIWDGQGSLGKPNSPEFLLVRLNWIGGETWGKAIRIYR